MLTVPVLVVTAAAPRPWELVCRCKEFVPNTPHQPQSPGDAGETLVALTGVVTTRCGSWTQAVVGPTVGGLVAEPSGSGVRSPSAEWNFLTNHARALVCIAHDPGVRLRDIASSLSITERSAFGIVTDLTTAGYVVKNKDGRRNRYRIEAHLPLPEDIGRPRTIGEMLELLVDNDDDSQVRRRA